MSKTKLNLELLSISTSKSNTVISFYETSTQYFHSYLIPISLQSISPGVVETEFGLRLYKDDAEKAAAVYSRFRVKKYSCGCYIILGVMTTVKLDYVSSMYYVTYHFSDRIWKSSMLQSQWHTS